MTSRRAFLGSLGTAGAAVAVAPLIHARGFEAHAAAVMRGETLDPFSPHPELDARGRAEIRLASNENPRGPGAAALAAVHAALAEGGRYPYALPPLLRADIAKAQGIAADQVLLGCGSGEILRMAVDAFTSPTRALVTASPTYEGPGNRANALGIPIHAVPVRDDLSLDLAAMGGKSVGAGLVFLCNPNNPTGTLHGAAAIEDFVRRVLRDSPDAMVLIDEAYHEYVDNPSYATALPLAKESPRVVVSRTFSKAYGIAGLRVGYAMGQAETLKKMAKHALPLALNVLGVAAARASLADTALPATERRLNGEARAWTRDLFERAGYRVAQSETNFLMVNIRRDAKAFQEAARAQGVLVGRPFPPLETWTRVSIGTMDEMRAAGDIMLRVLKTSS